MEDNIKIELNPQVDSECESIVLEIVSDKSNDNARLDEIDDLISDLDTSIDGLTAHNDRYDNNMAGACGLLTGIIDVVFVGKWDFASAKAWSSKEINERIISFAQQHPDYQEFIDRKRSVNEENRRANAVQFLERKYTLPGDNEWKYKGSPISAESHHLDDLCHHPTIIGLICCILVQFTGNSMYSDSTGKPLDLPVTVNQYGRFVGRNKIEKMFAGVINWFLTVAQVAANREGHLISDMAGSYSSVKRKNDGMGIPGGFLSTLKELSVLPCFKDTNFPQKLNRAFQNGIGKGKKQVDLGAFNVLFEGASSKFDMRTEMAIGHELKRQSIPNVINEVLVRACYFVRRLIVELKARGSILEVDWNNVIPFNNRTIQRMISIASGTFSAVDALDAVVEGAINSKANWVEFWRQVILRVNFVGAGRFTIALGTDVFMGWRREKKMGERMQLKAESLYLMNAKLYCGERLMWTAAKNANQSIEELYDAIREITNQLVCDTNDVQESIDEIEKIEVSKIEENNANLASEILDLL